MRMNDKAKKVLKLRFPEFTYKWKNDKLGNIFTERQETGFPDLPLMSLTDEYGLVLQQETNKKDNSSTNKSRYLRICEGDIVYNTMRMWQGRCAYCKNEGIVSPAYTVCIPKYTCDGVFFNYYFKTYGLIQKFHANSQGLVNDTLNLKFDKFSSITIDYPIKKEEQQKIADCLSSIDELIDAENRKLKALKKHKKGLMQKLFPAEEETLPEWRFPEFRDKNEWSIKPLGKICTNYDSRRVPITEKDRVAGNIPYIGASGVIDYINDFIFDEDLLCVSEDGANLIARTYPIAFSISGRTWVNNHAHVLKFANKYTQNIVESYLNMINLQDFLTGMAQPKLNRAKLDIIPISLPEEKEQKKIADCLSEIDTMIIVQSNKVEQLKKHKKGLMQGLFPSLEEADI